MEVTMLAVKRASTDQGGTSIDEELGWLDN
jgi:hypothetical protein